MWIDLGLRVRRVREASRGGGSLSGKGGTSEREESKKTEGFGATGCRGTPYPQR